ncbi:MAG: hypothetical protein GXC73_02830 [Chitinophagaceae bacterium]|nr:hypothetical protein [Chitinophagaceae bacterium]
MISSASVFYNCGGCQTKISPDFCAMFEKLRTKWNVGPLQLLLILCTFAIGGSLTGFLGKRIMPVFGIESPWLSVPVYIILVTLLWPMMVLLVSVPFGQFRFFTSYLKKMGQRMGFIKKNQSS